MFWSYAVRVPMGLLAAGLLAGCGASPGSLPPVSLGEMQGSVFGGQQPIQSAKIYLYAASTTAYGGASTSLLTSATGNPADSNGNYYVLTDALGRFGLTGDYTCTPGTQIYIVSMGGQVSPDVTNSAAGLMALLGQCPSSGTMASQVPKVAISELSTVAAAFAIAPYAVDATHIGAPGATSTPFK